MPRKPHGDKALTPAERMQASRRRQREREREAIDNPAMGSLQKTEKIVR